jgi:hypothetical protein
MFKPYTRHDVERLSFKDKKYELTIKFNSYKDGTVEVEIEDNENIKLSSEIINFNRKEFDVKVNNIIFKLLKDKVITINYMESIKNKNRPITTVNAKIIRVV